MHQKQHVSNHCHAMNVATKTGRFGCQVVVVWLSNLDATFGRRTPLAEVGRKLADLANATTYKRAKVIDFL